MLWSIEFGKLWYYNVVVLNHINKVLVFSFTTSVIFLEHVCTRCWGRGTYLTTEFFNRLWMHSVWSLSWEDPMEKGMTTFSSILAWRIPQTEELGGIQSMRPWRVRHNWATNHTQSFRLTRWIHFRDQLYSIVPIASNTVLYT